jgi:hypothetical protein
MGARSPQDGVFTLGSPIDERNRDAEMDELAVSWQSRQPPSFPDQERFAAQIRTAQRSVAIRGKAESVVEIFDCLKSQSPKTPSLSLKGL